MSNGIASRDRSLLFSFGCSFKRVFPDEETALRSHLFTLRTVIDQYTYDKHKAPQSLQDLVTEGYLRAIPTDPITKSADSWRILTEEPRKSIDPTSPGILDVHSGSDGMSKAGTPYSEW